MEHYYIIRIAYCDRSDLGRKNKLALEMLELKAGPLANW
jgi:hypothetical protein